MADVVDVKTRSRMMSGIRSKNTRPELLIRSLLHRAGFRFRLHKKNHPRSPGPIPVSLQSGYFCPRMFLARPRLFALQNAGFSYPLLAREDWP